MDFLKIAIGNGVNVNKMKGWSSIPIGDVQNSAELAAIVVKNDDALGIKQAEALREQSGFPIPLIKVTDQVDEDQVTQKATEYEKQMVPGFLTDLINFAQAKPISFTTPGHHNGQYYDKHPAGVVFNKFFGKNLMFADTSDTVPQLGDTMTHAGTPLNA
ncbi:MAG TPA: ornithine decarboxylase, partial [Lactobacillus crispatus]|nr:ornithine decarboxylase [Lactobacillus crispatus]